MAKGIIGAQLYTCRQYMQTIDDIAKTLKKIADIGYTAVQLSAIGPVDPKELAKVVSDLGLTVAATHEPWDKFQNNIDELIAEHKIWNCTHPAVGGLSENYRSADGVKQFLDELAPVAEALAAEGMDFSYHNHSHELVRYGEKTWLEMLYEQGDPKQLKAEIDTYWIQHGGGDPVAWIKKCAGREPILHLKDMKITVDRKQLYAEIGQGNLNWPAILQAAEQGGVEYYLVEQDDCYDRDPIDSLEISYRYLKEMGLS